MRKQIKIYGVVTALLATLLVSGCSVGVGEKKGESSDASSTTYKNPMEEIVMEETIIDDGKVVLSPEQVQAICYNWSGGDSSSWESLKGQILGVDLNTIDFLLDGSGYERFNKTSGTGLFGLTYSVSDSEKEEYNKGKYYYNKNGEKDVLIPMEDVFSIVEKDKNFRLDDIINYDHTCEEIGDGEYKIVFKVKNTEDIYVRLLFTEYKDVVHIKSGLAMLYKGNDEYNFDWIFNLYTQYEALKASMLDEPKGMLKQSAGIEQGSVTDSGLVIKMNLADSFDEKFYSEKLNTNYVMSYVLYKKTDNGWDEISMLPDVEFDETCQNCLGTSIYRIYVDWSEVYGILEQGDYKIKFGQPQTEIDTDDYFIEEYEFTVK